MKRDSGGAVYEEGRGEGGGGSWIRVGACGMLSLGVVRVLR